MQKHMVSALYSFLPLWRRTGRAAASSRPCPARYWRSAPVAVALSGWPGRRGDALCCWSDGSLHSVPLCWAWKYISEHHLLKVLFTDFEQNILTISSLKGLLQFQVPCTVHAYPIVTDIRGVTSVLSAYRYRIPLLQEKRKKHNWRLNFKILLLLLQWVSPLPTKVRLHSVCFKIHCDRLAGNMLDCFALYTKQSAGNNRRTKEISHPICWHFSLKQKCQAGK